MKKRRILSGGLVLIVMLAVLCTGVIGASASGITVTTSTAYNVGDPSLVTVTSKITGVEENDQITYLAYNEHEEGPYTDGDETNILFVEQLESKAGSGSFYSEFVYTTEVSKISSAIVRFGAQKTQNISAAGGDGNIGDPIIFAHNVNITETEGGTVNLLVLNAGGNWVSPDPEDETIVGDVTIELIPDLDKEIDGLVVTVDGDEREINLVINPDGTASLLIEDIDGDLVVTATFKDKEPVAEPSVDAASNFTDDGGTALSENNNVAVAFSKITPPSEGAYEYGVLLYFNAAYNSDNNIDLDSTTAPGEDTVVSRTNPDIIYKFQAIAEVNGHFAVKLIDERAEGNVLNDVFFLRPYLSYGEEVKFGEAMAYNE